MWSASTGRDDNSCRLLYWRTRISSFSHINNECSVPCLLASLLALVGSHACASNREGWSCHCQTNKALSHYTQRERQGPYNLPVEICDLDLLLVCSVPLSQLTLVVKWDASLPSPPSTSCRCPCPLFVENNVPVHTSTLDFWIPGLQAHLWWSLRHM